MPEEKVLFNSEEAAHRVTGIEGWVDKNGRFWGKDERAARYSGCTHMICECGNEMKKGYTKCENCIAKGRREKYLAMPFKEWNGEDILVMFSEDVYFRDEDEILEYLEDSESKPEDLMLCICEPNYFTPLDGSQWDDVLPEDADTLPKGLSAIIDEFNEKLKQIPAASYSQGKFRTEYKTQNNNL